MSTIIFLDIDGVILPFGRLTDQEVNDMVYDDPFGGLPRCIECHSKEAVEKVKALAKEHNAKVVIHSHWRRIFKDTLIKAYMKHIGLIDLLHLDWRCKMKLSSNKGYDVCLWMEDHPEFDHFIIIDDDKHEFVHLSEDRSHGKVKIEYIHPDPKVGLV